MKFNKLYLIVSLFLLGSYIQSSTYLKQNNDNTEVLSKILKEIEELKKGQEKLSNEIKSLKASNNNNNQKKGNANASTIKNVPIGNSVVLGNPKAPVTIIKWTDFQ